MNYEDGILVDGRQPATMNDGDGKLVDCPSLREAVLGLARVAPGATIAGDGQSHRWIGLQRTRNPSPLLPAAPPKAAFGDGEG
jgi:hypothetical protein